MALCLGCGFLEDLHPLAHPDKVMELLKAKVMIIRLRCVGLRKIPTFVVLEVSINHTHSCKMIYL